MALPSPQALPHGACLGVQALTPLSGNRSRFLCHQQLGAGYVEDLEVTSVRIKLSVGALSRLWPGPDFLSHRRPISSSPVVRKMSTRHNFPHGIFPS